MYWAVCWGIYAAWRHGSPFDTILSPTMTLLSAIPYFWLALLILYVLGYTLNWFPFSDGYDLSLTPDGSFPYIVSVIYHAILPALTIVISSMLGWLLTMRNTMITTLSEDYVLLAQAKGLSERRVIFSYAARNAILPNVTGFALALVGESGSGKTTVARMLARLYPATAGAITFQGRNIASGGRSDMRLRDYRRYVQLIFQDPFSSLNPTHDVRYHLSRPLRLFGHASTETEVMEQALALLQRVSLTPAEQFLVKYPHQLSGGQRQRVAIARALAVRPTVLLADEPVSMLDVSIRLDILNLLAQLKEDERLALLYIMHDIARARYFADETLVMYAGQTVEGGPSETIPQQPKHPYTQLLLAAAPDPDRLRNGSGRMLTTQARGEIPSLVTPPTGCRFHPRCPHVMPSCKERFPARTELGGGQWVNCFLYGEGNVTPAAPQ
ncbi:MAG: oligopeptide/dipeptide ABC transporter ATP-binding protein [Ktedonobacterales bacterium]